MIIMNNLMLIRRGGAGAAGAAGTGGGRRHVAGNQGEVSIVLEAPIPKMSLGDKTSLYVINIFSFYGWVLQSFSKEGTTCLTPIV